MYKKLFAIVAGLFLIGALAAFTLQTQTTSDQSTQRTISVSGSGQVYLTPDIAYINIGVQTENADAATAVSNNNTQSQKVIDALKAQGVDAKDIRTTDFSIYPQQQTNSQGQSTGVTKYVVNNTVYVTLRSLDKIGAVLNGVVAAGANSINGIQFDVADRSQALSQARQAAISDANAQAQELAKAAGVTLGAVQSISTVSSTPTPIPYGLGGGGVASSATANVPVSAGQLTVTVQANVVYAIQ